MAKATLPYFIEMIMPVNRSMMKELKKQYGKEKGTDVYYALENKRKQNAKKPKAKKAKP